MHADKGTKARLSVGPTVRYSDMGSDQAGGFAKDWRRALGAASDLTKDQQAGLAELPPAIVEHVQAAAANVARGGGAVPRIHITLFHCHFDANFRNWHCFLGGHREDEVR